MNKIRLYSLLLALAMLLSACAAGGTEESGESSAPSGSEQTEPGPSDATEPNQPQDTALQVMEALNGKLTPSGLDDKYRSYYEIFVYSFYDSDGDGVGDLQGVIEKLDYINDGDPDTNTDLGATGIWLMPVNPSPTYHKYDVKDYTDIDPEYGTLDDFKALLDACHERGIRVIMDLVMNHTSSQHPWFTKAVEYLKTLEPGAEPDLTACPYVGYYNFSREKKSATSYQVEGTEWYYEAPFWSEMPDLDLSCVAVRSELATIAEYWLDFGVDGFRLDAAKEFYSGDPESNIAFLSWFNGVVKEKNPDAYIVAEVWNDLNTYASYYRSGIDSVFNFSFGDSNGTIAKVVKGSSPASAYGAAIENAQAAFAAASDTYIDAPFYTNHDMGRSAGYYPGDYTENQVKLALALNLTMSGASFTYYGEELGMKGAGKDENKRAPMYWSEDPEAPGMTDGPKDMGTVNMIFESQDRQAENGNSILNFTIEALKIRNSIPAVSHGVADMVESLSTDKVCVLTKTFDNESVTLVYNISPEPQTVDVSSLDLKSVTAALVTTAESPTLNNGKLTLPMYSVAVLSNTNI